MQSARNRQTCVRTIVGRFALLCGLLVLLALAAQPARAQDPPPQEPGVTQRAFQLPRALSELCTIKAGQTPNVDVLQPTIDWTGDAAFGGLSQNFIVHAIANLTVPTAGTYTFRLTSDDGSELLIDDALVIDHDGLHGAEDKDGSVELTAGMHALRINYFEAGGDEQLTLSWRQPGESAFSVVPNSVLSTDAGVVRVTAPGSKECEGDVDSPGDGLPLDGVNPAYDLVNLRPAGFEPKVTGLEWMGDDLLVLTWGDDDGDPSSVTAAGEVWKLSGVKTADDPGDVTPHADRRGPARADGHQGRRRRPLHLREAPAEQAASTPTRTASTRARTRSRRGRSTATSTSSRSACSTRTATSTRTSRSRSTSAAPRPCRRAPTTAACT